MLLCKNLDFDLNLGFMVEIEHDFIEYIFMDSAQFLKYFIKFLLLIIFLQSI